MAKKKAVKKKSKTKKTVGSPKKDAKDTRPNFSISFSQETLKKIDDLKGDASRSRFCERGVLMYIEKLESKKK